VALGDGDLLDPYADGVAPTDATVTSIDEDRENPGWSFVSFSDGTSKTMATEQAQALPQPAPVDPGFSAVPGEPPLTPDQLAATGTPGVPVEYNAVSQAWDAAGSDPFVQAAEAHQAPPGYVAPLGRPTNPNPGAGPGFDTTTGRVGTGASDPGSQIVAPGSAAGAGGYAPYSRQYGEDVTSDTTADAPEDMQARLAAAGEAVATSAYDQAVRGYDATIKGLETREASARQEEARLQRQRRERELLVEEHQKVIKGIEDNPLDEDAFWSDSPGRQAAAWIALALSGFLQGISRGQNPALNQMMGALNGAKESFMRRQQADRDSILKRREAAMGDERTAMASLDMQINGLISKYSDLQAQAAGVPLPPSLETVRAQNQLAIAQGQNEIGRITTERATRRAAEEERALPAQTPLRRGDVVLQQQLGMDRKAIDSAFDPNDGNVPGTVQSAERLQEIKTELDAIKQKYGGELPQQNLLSYSTVGAAGVAARLGSEPAADQLRAKGLLSEVEQMVKQASGTTKLWDSNQEREDLLRRINTGEAGTTMEVVDRLVARANQNAIAAAQRYTRDPQGLIDFIRMSQQSNAGVAPGQPQVSRTLAPGQRPAQAQPTQPAEGGAQPPLAPPGPQQGTQAPPMGPDLVTPAASSLRGTYRQLRASRLNVPR
jgi:hypothetical protein